jgi:chromosome segregation ATPase
MSKHAEDLEKRLLTAEQKAKDAEREVKEVSGANGRIAARLAEAESALARTHRDRDDAFRQIAVLERQVANRDAENAKLAGELESALAVIEAGRAAAAWKPRVVR